MEPGLNESPNVLVFIPVPEMMTTTTIMMMMTATTTTTTTMMMMMMTMMTAKFQLLGRKGFSNLDLLWSAVMKNMIDYFVFSPKILFEMRH